MQLKKTDMVRNDAVDSNYIYFMNNLTFSITNQLN